MSDMPRVFIIGGCKGWEDLRSSLQGICEIHDLSFDGYNVGDELPAKPDLILCKMPPKNISPIEISQSLRMFYADIPIYLLVYEKSDYLRGSLLKNGFMDVFFLPNDIKTFEIQIRRDVAVLTKGALQVFREVPLVDLEPGLRLGFDLYIYLPANGKYVKYISADDSLSAEKAEKLKKHQFQSASVGEHQMVGFYKYSAERLRSVGQNPGLSETEKKERKEKAIRTLLTGFFATAESSDTMESGRGFLKDCGEVVKEYVKAENSNSWYNRFLTLSGGDGDTYNHAGSVSSLACLLAIGLGISEIEEVGLAGLLHDIGIADLPPEICEKPGSQRTVEEAKIYESHPKFAVDMIRNKKMMVSEKVIKIILQHHERFDGTGYPAKLVGDKICIEAQILRVADEIEKYMNAEGTKNPKEVAKKILSGETQDSPKKMIDPVIADRLRKILGLDEEGSDGRNQAA